MEAVMAGPGHPEACGGPALRVELTRLPLPTEITKTFRGLTPQGWAAARKAAADSPQA